ncbi:MAG: M48 family metalloprotease [Actinomycetota bacterium]|jgi:Zn-dependent protease with chaperone function|nr:MAG: peptidase M48 family protein [Acidimicrobiaceae bacterium]
MRWGGRTIETSALAAFAPVIMLLPLCLVALAVLWLPLSLVNDVSYTWFVVAYLLGAALLFIKPVQVLILTRALGTRRPTRDERVRLDTAWRSVLQAARLPGSRYVLAVLPAEELNAFACGGHLVVVTTLAIETLPRDELAGVLAHELSHHLGLHTVALTITQWIGLPVMLLARAGFYLQNVATAATTSFASHSAALTALGRLATAVLNAVSWVLLSGLIVANTIGNVAGRGAEYQADQRAVSLGFGGELSNALRRLIALGGGERPHSLRERLAATHPAARTRIARIDSARRAQPGRES